MKSIQKILMAITLLLSVVGASAQIKNSVTEKVKINGNCDMCKSNIEKAGSVKKVATVVWDKDTKMATLTYDSKVTSQDEILKRVAAAGYDSARFKAADEVYNNLHGCCQYERNSSSEVAAAIKIEFKNEAVTSPIQTVFESYFSLKDALIQANATATVTIADEMSKAIVRLQVGNLSESEQVAWMKYQKDLAQAIQLISATADVEKQRVQFIVLSKTVSALMKDVKSEFPVYIQFCPMANNGQGASWLSKEAVVKNPYFGSQMLSCGKVVETIQ